MSRLGAHYDGEADGWSFALWSERASSVTLELYADTDPEQPVRSVELSRSAAGGEGAASAVWRATVPGPEVADARWYGYRVSGPDDPASGHRFDPDKLLVDPYAREIVFPPGFTRAAARAPGDNRGRAPLAVLPRSRATAPRAAPPRHPLGELVVYELHVRGFTRRASSGVTADRAGTYAGLVEKIPYLQDLGVTAVELLPVFQYDPQEGNYWGYMPIGFFAPHRGYAAGDDPAAELARTVESFHRAGIEVWIDVVYNHTAEGGADGPTYSFRGIDNAGYYLHEPGLPGSGDRARYRNDSGTGNVFACARPAPRRLVLDSLRWWSEEIGVAGFRFDLATLLARDGEGRLEERSAVLAEIEALAADTGVRLVAEPWDLGAYRLGESFPGRGWWQWNGRFRDAVRGFVRGDRGLERETALSLGGSPDLFPPAGGRWGPAGVPVNYVTCHDGFNLWDLVSYDRKHNLANGWDNRDGPADDRSWNCGWEGDEGAPDEVLALRRRQVRNLVCLTLLSAGVPMLFAGDELLHTRGGNNNPYNQDNETTWLDWDRREQDPDFHRFVRGLIALRKAHPGLASPWARRAAWYSPDGPAGDGGDLDRSFACRLPAAATGTRAELFLAANASAAARSYRLPGEGWCRVVDTAASPPDDVVEDPGRASRQPDPVLHLPARSIVVLRRPV